MDLFETHNEPFLQLRRQIGKCILHEYRPITDIASDVTLREENVVDGLEESVGLVVE